MRLRRPFCWWGAVAVLVSALAAQTPAVHTNVVVDSNPAVFAMLAALNAAGYHQGLNANEPIRAAVLRQIQAHPPAVLPQLRAYYQLHHRSNPNQNLAQYVTLAMFVGNPPGLTLTLPPSGLPPDAQGVSDVLPLVRDFWQQADMDAVWQNLQPRYAAALAGDATVVRTMLAQVNAFFRIPQAYSPRQFFIFPDALIAPGQADALNYEDNYYIVANLHLKPELRQVRHTYLHFLLAPLVAQFPAAADPVRQYILPLVAHAPALGPQFKADATLLLTECLVRAVEIQLDPGTAVAKAASVQAAVNQGLVLTGLWYGQLTAYRDDPASFTQYYPQAAFALQVNQLAGSLKHMQFSPAPPPAQAIVQPVRAPGPLEQAQRRLDAKDFTGAAALANAALRQPGADQAGAYFLLGKVAALQNQAQPAMDNFQLALTHAQPRQTHVRTWANMYLARLYDARRQRAEAVKHYQAALTTADTPASKAMAQAGIKAPFLPQPGHGGQR